jgi:histidinol-phosphate aminotransferase
VPASRQNDRWKERIMDNLTDTNRFWNEKTRHLIPYTPGEQPRDQAYIKLNTNENPYPPPAEVLQAIQSYPPERIRLYPDPTSLKLRTSLAEYFGLDKAGVFVGNGSDEVLAMAFQAFFTSRRDLAADSNSAAKDLPPAEKIAFADITYSFYPVYARFYDVPFRLIKLDEDFTLPLAACLEKSAGLVIANPNAPTGIAADLDTLAAIAAADRDRLVIIDEAYVDFGAASAVGLLDQFDNILVIQTCSKSRSLAGLRVGYALAAPGLIEGLERIRDSFNSYTLDSLAQAAATAAFGAAEWFVSTRNKIIATRERTAAFLQELGFQVLPSSANFLFVRHPACSGADLYKGLRQAGILVRHFRLPRIENFLRISIGTDLDMDQLVKILPSLLA